MLSDAIHRCHERFIIHVNKPGNAYSKSFDYTEFIKTVQAIAGNALQSSDYASACGNLRLCIHEVHALLLSSENDDGSEPLLTLMDDLAMRVRCYMENVAEFADSPTAGKALNTIAQAANDKDMRQYEPLNSMLLISSALAFAQYDDKRMWAYDVIENAITRNLEYSFNEESEESDEDDEDTNEVDGETDFFSATTNPTPITWVSCAICCAYTAVSARKNGTTWLLNWPKIAYETSSTASSISRK